MRNIIFISLLLAATFRLNSASGSDRVSTSVDHVTFHPDGAMIERMASVNLPSGESSWILTGFPEKLPDSLITFHIKGTRAYPLNHKFLNPDPEEWKKLRDVRNMKRQLAGLEKEIRLYSGKLDNIIAEEEMVYLNRKLGGDEGIFLEDLEDMAVFMRIHLEDILEKRIELEEILESLKNDHKKLKTQLSSHKEIWLSEGGKVKVKIHSESRSPSHIVVVYPDFDAGWVPVHYVHARRLNRPVNWEQSAHAWQNSAVKWENFTVTLKTGSVMEKNSQKVKPWMVGTAVTDNEQLPPDYTGPEAQRTVIIQGRHTFLGDGRNNLLKISQKSLDCTFKHILNPRSGNTARLKGMVSSRNLKGLMKGDLYTFLNNEPAGKQKFNQSRLNRDTFSLDFGIINNITVKHEAELTASRTRRFGRIREHTYRISNFADNDSGNEVSILLKDKFPISREEAVTIFVDGILSNPQIDRKTGTIQWEFQLQAGESREVIYELNIRHPDGKDLTGF